MWLTRRVSRADRRNCTRQQLLQSAPSSCSPGSLVTTAQTHKSSVYHRDYYSCYFTLIRFAFSNKKRFYQFLTKRLNVGDERFSNFYRATANATHGLAVAFLSIRLSVCLTNACIVTKKK